MVTSVKDCPTILLTASEAAKVLRLSERSLFALTKRGEVPSVRIGARGVRYSVRALEQWVEQQQSTVEG